MDEPCSALDPIATAKVEELIDLLKERFTIVIVTHNMQQATRCSDFTAFFYLGRLIEIDRTEKYSVVQARNIQKTISQADLDRFGLGNAASIGDLYRPTLLSSGWDHHMANGPKSVTRKRMTCLLGLFGHAYNKIKMLILKFFPGLASGLGRVDPKLVF